MLHFSQGALLIKPLLDSQMCDPTLLIQSMLLSPPVNNALSCGIYLGADSVIASPVVSRITKIKPQKSNIIVRSLSPSLTAGVLRLCLVKSNRTLDSYS
jgi:hypothetical protein